MNRFEETLKKYDGSKKGSHQMDAYVFIPYNHKEF
ncbi:unnamed protein product (macronuclear) [Paramecium tetraurelia]|uniref:Uncharacterized protein n=1 Tax=Paramecium tetraurelia TaxID=5888 RepID=A0DDJ8_PARTE|nr:uncharacterized protein GSPATT00015975001 [Paramecium tetraurelia]CAK81115.1 unnamed protein product [Paramecium tetraurelia]